MLLLKQDTKKSFSNISTPLMKTSNLQLKTSELMEPCHSWTLLSYHKMMEVLTTVYRKPTDTNQYLQWDSHHAISAKYSFISTLFHRAKDVCSTKEQLEEEHTHIQKVLISCKCPRWPLNRMKMKTRAPVKPKNNKKKKEEY